MSARRRTAASAGPLWYANLGRELTANLAGDLVIQVLVLAFWYWHVRSAWLLAIWGIRWVVIGGIVVSEFFRRRRRLDLALAALLGGHQLGVLATVPIAPEIGPLAIFVLIGDLLFIARYELRREFTPWAAAASVMAIYAALASLQPGARLGPQAPSTLFYAFIIGSAVGNGGLTALGAAVSRRELLDSTARLEQTSRRLAVAGLEQRQMLSAALASGPLASLRGLATTVDSLTAGNGEAQLAAAERAVGEAQAVAALLREFAHGVFPDALRQHGLSDALVVLAQRARCPVTVTSRLGGIDPDTAMTVYFCCATVLDWAADADSMMIELRSSEWAVTATVDVHGEFDNDPTELVGQLRERLQAADGALTVNRGRSGLRSPGRTSVSLHVPIADDSRGVGATVGSDVQQSRQANAPSLRGVLALALPIYAVALASVRFAPQFVLAVAALSLVPVLAALPLLSTKLVAAAVMVQTTVAGSIAAVGVRRALRGDLDRFPSPALAMLVALATAASVAGVAWLLARTHAQLVERSQDLRRSQARLVAASDEERRRIERDLHDGGQQQCVALAIQLRALTRVLSDQAKFDRLLAGVLALIAAAESDLRQLGAGAAPVRIDDGLGAALERALLASATRVEIVNRAPAHLDPQVGTAAYFCCLESVQNAIKHAGDAATITITLSERDGRLRFEVADDGVGFEPEKVAAGHGIRSLTERVEALGGRIALYAEPRKGTSVVGELPLASLTSAAPSR